MKCLKHKEDGYITRVTDEAATMLVKSGNWNFTSREEWKTEGRNYRLPTPYLKDLNKGANNG